MTTYLLVHGAWHGGWCWKLLLPFLKHEDNEVFTPTLTGLGERHHLIDTPINLTTHVQDIINVMLFEDLKDVILVGHSYAGVVISGVAERCPERIKHLVFLDAFVPENGEAVNDISIPEFRLPTGPDISYPPIQPISPNELGITDPDIIAWIEPKLTPHPSGTLFEPLALTSKLAQKIPRSFISCVVGQAKNMGTVAKSAAKVRGKSNWVYHELNTGHNAMMTEPKELATLLLKLA